MADKYFSKNSYINDKDELVNELTQKKSALKGKPAELFRFFLDHPRRIYSKDDLLDALWPEGGGSYEGIYVHLNAIKSALKKIDEEKVVASRYGQGYYYAPSEELLARAEITILDVWRTWCHFCIEEFPDLDAIQSEFAAQGVQVLTVCDDAENEELKAQAEELAKPYRFRTFVKSESFNQALRWSGTPTAYFLDKEGKVLDFPIIGKNPAALREKLNDLLEGSAAKKEEMKTEMKTAVYTVFVKDQYGQPVPGVKLGFCSDCLCHAIDTDANGKAVFEGDAFAWHMQVLKSPSGYAAGFEEDVFTEEVSGTLHLTLHKN